MLLDPFSAAVLQDKRKSLKYLAILLGVVVLAAIYPIIKSYSLAQTPRDIDTMGSGVDSVRHLGQVLFNVYLLPFELTSVLILVAIIGVVVLAKRQS
jgi:NADH-quinone oxidoreductase subunit J